MASHNEDEIIRENKALIKKHPYLRPKEPWVPDEAYDYTYTFLDDMPVGWKKAFGEKMCDEITGLLTKYNCLQEYRVVQVKEKYGSLRWYDDGVPEDAYNELCKIIDKYEAISEKTCCRCGAPATKISLGWICPWCDKCANDIEWTTKFEDINCAI